jgi:hypothetical protein
MIKGLCARDTSDDSEAVGSSLIRRFPKDMSSNGHLRKRGVRNTAITGFAFTASQKETPVIAVISTFHTCPVMWITRHSIFGPGQRKSPGQ